MNPRDSECPLSKGRHLVAKIHNCLLNCCGVEWFSCMVYWGLGREGRALNQVTSETLSYFAHMFGRDSTFNGIHLSIYLFIQQTFILIVY